MIEFENIIESNRPVEEVFSFVSNFENILNGIIMFLKLQRQLKVRLKIEGHSIKTERLIFKHSKKSSLSLGKKFLFKY
jgi:hypothetical protein